MQSPMMSVSLSELKSGIARLFPTIILVIAAQFGMALKTSAQDAPATPAVEDPKPDAKAYKTLPIFKSLDDTLLVNDKAGRAQQAKARAAQRNVMKTISDALKGDVIVTDSEVQGRFDAWFEQFVFPKMTQLETIDQIPQERKKFFRTYMERAATPQVHDYLVNLTLRNMETIAKENFHPAARYNAMLIIGMLNSKESINFGSNKRPPEPLLRALKTLLDEFENPDQIDGVRVACLIGVLRHVEMDRQKLPNDRMPLNAKNLITKSVLNLLKSDPPEHRSAEGHLWMQRRAVDIIAAIGDVGTEGEILAELERILADEKSLLSIRCACAVAIGRLRYPTETKVDAAVKAMAVANLATFACRAEIKLVEETEKRLRADLLSRRRVNAGSDSGGSPGQSASPDALGSPLRRYHITLLRRRLGYHLYSVHQSLTGTGPETEGIAKLPMSDAQRKFIQEVIDRTEAISKLTDDKELELAELKREILAEVALLERAVSNAPVPKKPAASDTVPGAIPGGGPAGDLKPDSAPAVPGGSAPPAE